MDRSVKFVIRTDRKKSLWFLPLCILLAVGSCWLAVKIPSAVMGIGGALLFFCSLVFLRRIIWPWIEIESINSEIRADDLSDLAELKNIGSLSLNGCHIQEEGLAALTDIHELQELDLSKTNVGDQDIASLQMIRGLVQLQLNHTNVTDACVNDLAKLPKLHCIAIEDTCVTQEGRKRLRKLVPGILVDDEIWN